MVFHQLLFVGFTAVVAINKAVNYLDDYENLAEEDYDNLSLRSLMAMLVHCAYFRDLNVAEGAAAWILDYNNKRANGYGKLHWESYPCQASEPELKELGLAFFTRKCSHSNPNAPGLAIVLRGTIPTKSLDLLADLRIGLERLKQSNRVLRTVRLIVQVVEEFRSENPLERICMAGHSLGAAICLIVGGCLIATHNIYIDTHLFNPPLLTLVDVIRGRALPRPTAPANFDGDDHVPELEVDFVQLKEVFHRVCGNVAAMNAEWAQFHNLRHWTPHLYLNPGDPFCHKYINFYRARRGQPVGTPGEVMSAQGLLSSLFNRNPTYFKSVVPSADLHISTWERGHRRLAHSLRQWHKYKPEYIELLDYRVRLLPISPPRDRRPPRDLSPPRDRRPPRDLSPPRDRRQGRYD